MGLFVFLICLVAGLVGVVGFLYALIRRRNKKLWLITIAVSLVGFVVGANWFASTQPPTEHAATSKNPQPANAAQGVAAAQSPANAAQGVAAPAQSPTNAAQGVAAPAQQTSGTGEVAARPDDLMNRFLARGAQQPYLHSESSIMFKEESDGTVIIASEDSWFRDAIDTQQKSWSVKSARLAKTPGLVDIIQKYPNTKVETKYVINNPRTVVSLKPRAGMFSEDDSWVSDILIAQGVDGNDISVAIIQKALGVVYAKEGVAWFAKYQPFLSNPDNYYLMMGTDRDDFRTPSFIKEFGDAEVVLYGELSPNGLIYWIEIDPKVYLNTFSEYCKKGCTPLQVGLTK